MRKCKTCGVSYPDDQFHCIQCGLPTEEDENQGNFAVYEDVDPQKIKKSTLVLFWINIVTFNIVALYLAIFGQPKYKAMIFVLFVVLYSLEQIRKLKRGKFEHGLFKGNLFYNIWVSIFTVVFTIFWLTSIILGGTPASDYNIQNCQTCEVGKYYLFNAGVLTEVNFTTYQWMGYFENIMLVFIPLWIVIMIASSLFTRKNKNQ